MLPLSDVLRTTPHHLHQIPPSTDAVVSPCGAEATALRRITCDLQVGPLLQSVRLMACMRDETLDS